MSPAYHVATGGSVKVLLADDDRVLTHLLSTKLRARGLDVVVAHDSMQALMSAMRSPTDAIVLDIQMPGGTGIEALRKLKASTKTSLHPGARPQCQRRRGHLGAGQSTRGGCRC